MRRLWLVAAREYVENVRTKTFLIAVFMTPVMFGLSLLVPTVLGKVKPSERKLAIVDVTGRLGTSVAADLATPNGPEHHPDPPYGVEVVDLGAGDAAAREAKAQERAADLDERVKKGDLYAWVRIRPSAFSRDGGATEYRTGNLIDLDVQEHVRAAIRNATDTILIQERQVPPDAAALLRARLPFDANSVLAQTKVGSAAATITPMFFALLLFLTIVAISQALVTTTIEEKSTRVVEVLLSSLSPLDLMGGKILGTCLVGLTLMAIWTFGVVAALASNGMLSLVDGRLLVLCVLYYLLGFGLIASLMVAVGSACNSLKEAQNLISPLMILLTLPLIFWVVVQRDPNGPIATGLSFVPFFTPFWMMMRVSSATPPPAWQVPASLAVLALSTWLAVRLAARVFRVGVLLYGKPPSLREIFRWMRVKA